MGEPNPDPGEARRRIDAVRDQRLDAVALVESVLAKDDRRDDLLHAPDDVEHWRGVAALLAVWHAGVLHEYMGDGSAAYLAELRRHILVVVELDDEDDDDEARS